MTSSPLKSADLSHFSDKYVMCHYVTSSARIFINFSEYVYLHEIMILCKFQGNLIIFDRVMTICHISPIFPIFLIFLLLLAIFSRTIIRLTSNLDWFKILSMQTYSETFVKIRHDDVTSHHLMSYGVPRKLSKNMLTSAKNEPKWWNPFLIVSIYRIIPF